MELNGKTRCVKCGKEIKLEEEIKFTMDGIEHKFCLMKNIYNEKMDRT